MTALRFWEWKRTLTNSRVRATCRTTCTRSRICHRILSPTTIPSPTPPLRTSWCRPWTPNHITWTIQSTQCLCPRIYRHYCPGPCPASTPCPNLSQKAFHSSSHNLRRKWKCQTCRKTTWFRWSTSTFKKKLFKSSCKDAKLWKWNCCIPYCPNWSHKRPKWFVSGKTWLQLPES